MRTTWSDVEEFVTHVKDKYEDDEISGVYGIPRGGIVLAVMVSHALDVPLLLAPCPNCLVIDDISDSGDTLAPYVGKYRTATMFCARNTKTRPECWLYESGFDWIVFPWEAD